MQETNTPEEQVTFVDNYDSTLRELAEFLSENLPVGTRSSDEERLEAFLKGETTRDSFHFEVERDTVDGRVSCTFEASIQRMLKRYERDTDSEGNKWTEALCVQCSINHPCWGNSNLVVSQARIDLFQELVNLGKKVEHRFDYEVRQLIQTKAQIEEFKLQAERANKVLALTLLARDSCKNMRVNVDRVVSNYTGFDLNGLENTFELIGKSYHVKCIDNKIVIARTR